MLNNFSHFKPSMGFNSEYYYNGKKDKLTPRTWTAHVHDRLEVYVLEEGDVSFMVENTVYKLEQGDAVIIKPNEVHNCILNSESVHNYYCFWFDVEDEFLFNKLLSHEFGENNVIRFNEADRERFIDICSNLCNSGKDKDDLNQYRLFIEFLSLISNNINSNPAENNIPIELSKILRDINKHFKDITSVNEISEKYGVSRSTVLRLFKKYLHTSPKNYLETKKLAYSRVLLRKGESVLASSIESGFSDYSNYIRAFKRRFNVTPKEYQNS